MANIRWDGPGSVSITSNDSVMEEVELGTSYEYDLDFMKHLSEYEGRFDIEIEQDYLGKDLNKYHDLVPLKKLSNNLGCGLNYEIHIPDKLKGHKMTISPIVDDLPIFDIDSIIRAMKEEEVKTMYFEESLVYKNLSKYEGRFNMIRPRFKLGDKVTYCGISFKGAEAFLGCTAMITGVVYDPVHHSWAYRITKEEYDGSTTSMEDVRQGFLAPYVDYTSKYIASDTIATFTFMNNCFHFASMEISKVIFNPPATIVFWKDNEKTIVKCAEGDTFDQEKGLAMAICKKLFGSNKSGSDYYDGFNEIFEAMRSDDPEKAIAMKLIEKKKGKKYFKDICKKYCSEPKPVKEEPKKDNNPCTDCPDRKKGCLTNCEKMQEFVNDIQNVELESPKPIEPGYFIKHAEERKNKPKAHAASPVKNEIPVLNINFDPKPITNFVERFDATMFPSNFLAFCRKNNLYFFIADTLKGGMKAIDPYTTNWQQVTRYLKRGVMESCMKIKSHDINKSFLAVDMDRALFAKLPVELRGENRKGGE